MKNPNLNILDFQSNKHVPDINEKFVDACENGDYQTVQRILEAIKDFNINVTDNLGRTALRLAVDNEHLEVVELLLEKSDSPKIREALLLAIYLGHNQIAEIILKHPKYKVLNEKKFGGGDTDSFWQTPSSDDAQFPPDITPLMLSAQYNRNEIVQILLINGDRITKPHDYNCKCNECVNRFKFDSLRHAQSRLNAFRGLASESYISLASIDPILTAFELGYELRLLANKEKYFKNEYSLLADNLSMYCCKLLNNVRGRDELEKVLYKTGKESEEKFRTLARFDLALKYKEKPFVAHSNCQQKLVEIWYAGIRKFSKMNQFVLLFIILAFIPAIPFLSVFYMIMPNSKLGRLLSQPCVKFISHLTSYMGFIAMIIASSTQFQSEISTNALSFQKFLEADTKNDFFSNYTLLITGPSKKFTLEFQNFFLRRSEPTRLDLVITVWLFGFMWQEAKQIFHEGLKEYLQSWQNILNSTMNIIYLASFFLKYYTIVEVILAKQKAQSPEFWLKMTSENSSTTALKEEFYRTIYWLNADRFFWVGMDPINMSEGLFAVANLLSFMRICFYLPANQQIGPLQISLGNMISDVSKFLVIFLIFFVAFGISLNNLFWYYSKTTRVSLETINHNQTQAEKNFGNIASSMLTIFWSMFGLGQSSDIQLDPFNNMVTEWFGILIYGVYHVCCIIILLNMLIASMTHSYETILLQSDIEWKFARSKLYMEYIKEGSTLPIPFNIIPTPKAIAIICRYLINFIRKKKRPMEEMNMPRQQRRDGLNINTPSKPNGKNDIRKRSTSNEELTYIKVMQRIVKRFLLHKQRETDEVSEADFDELKQDLQMVRYEMNNDLKRYREENYRLISHIHSGILLLGEELYKKSSASSMRKFKEYKDIEKFDDYDANENDLIHNIKIELQNNSKSNRHSSLGECDEDDEDAKDIGARIMQSNDFYEYKDKVAKKISEKVRKDLHVISEDENED